LNTALNSLLHTALTPTDYTLLTHGLLICHLKLQHLKNDK
jgi:hypothetical protein